MKKTKEEKKEVKKSTRVIGIIINVLLVIAIIFAFICTYTAFVSKSGNGVPNLFGVIPLSIQSNSMSPTFDEGDLIIVHEVKDPDTLVEGDIITFWTIIDGQRVLNTHRIISIEDGGTFRYFYTKGDNNTIEDAMTVHESEVVGKYSTKIKGLGTVLDFLQTSKGFLIVIVLPILAFFIYYLVSFFKTLLDYNGAKKRLEVEAEIEERTAKAAAEAATAAGAAPADTIQNAASGDSENITLTKEQLMALLKQAGVTAPPAEAPAEEVVAETPAEEAPAKPARKKAAPKKKVEAETEEAVAEAPAEEAPAKPARKKAAPKKKVEEAPQEEQKEE